MRIVDCVKRRGGFRMKIVDFVTRIGKLYNLNIDVRKGIYYI
jgi:hypothetical protein